MEKGKIKSMVIKDFEVKNGDRKGAKFQKVQITFECVDDRGEIRKRTGSFGVEYVREYLAQLGITGKDALDREVVIFVGNFKGNDGKTYTRVKFFNFVDENGEVIKKERKEDEELPF